MTTARYNWRSSQTHYDSTTHTYTISVQEGTMGALAAPAYAGTLAVRGTISVSSVPTGAPAGADMGLYSGG